MVRNSGSIIEYYKNTTLSGLYNPNITPKDLVKAHEDLDKVVDKCYGKQTYNTEMKRLKLLFVLYKSSTARLFPVPIMKKSKAQQKTKK